MATAKAALLKQLADDIGGFTHDPLGYALYAFPWGEEGTDLAKHPGPRKWQQDRLREIGEHLQNPTSRYSPCRIAVASGHGIGKWSYYFKDQLGNFTHASAILMRTVDLFAVKGLLTSPE